MYAISAGSEEALALDRQAETAMADAESSRAPAAREVFGCMVFSWAED